MVLANVPSFRFAFWGNIRTYPRSGFRSGGTSERTLVPVSVLGEHPPKPPFCKPPLRGPGRRSLGAKSQKVSKKSLKSLPEPPGASRPRGPKSPKKVSTKVRKVSKKSENGLFSETFQTFFETFFGLLGPRGREAPGDFFETFWRLFGFWPRDSFSQVHGIPNHLRVCQPQKSG